MDALCRIKTYIVDTIKYIFKEGKMSQKDVVSQYDNCSIIYIYAKLDRGFCGLTYIKVYSKILPGSWNYLVRFVDDFIALNWLLKTCIKK